ncbi:MAG TPA: NrsF family protein [Polyangiaceae bacterium]|nr:NrsF family protein [Polyangiaceae bacterium]
MTGPDPSTSHPDLFEIPDPLASGASPPLPAVHLPVERPTRRERQRSRHYAFVFGAAWLVLDLTWFGLRGDLNRLPVWYWLATVASPVLAAVISVVVALAPGARGLGAKGGLLATIAILPSAALFFSALFLTSHALTPELASNADPAGQGSVIQGTWVDAAYCFNVGLAFAGPPALAALLALRRSFVVNARWRAALIGSAAGLCAAALLNLHCSVVGPWHVAAAHTGATLVFALLGAFAFARYLRA